MLAVSPLASFQPARSCVRTSTVATLGACRNAVSVAGERDAAKKVALGTSLGATTERNCWPEVSFARFTAVRPRTAMKMPSRISRLRPLRRVTSARALRVSVLIRPMKVFLSRQQERQCDRRVPQDVLWLEQPVQGHG